MKRRSYLEYKKYLEVKEGIGFQWTQDLVGGLQDILKAFTRGRRAAAINQYFDKVFEYGKLRGTEIGENVGPKLEESINKEDFKYEQLVLEIEWSKTAIVNIRKYIFEIIKQVVGEVTANNIRESKIEVPTFLKLINEVDRAITVGDANNKIGKPYTSSVSVPGVKPSYTSTSSNNTSQKGQPHVNPNNQLPSGTQTTTNQAVDADYEIIDDKTPLKDSTPPTESPKEDEKSEKTFQDMTETERIKLLSFLDQRIQDFIEMKSPMVNKVLKIWSEFLFLKNAQPVTTVEEEPKKNESFLNEAINIPLGSYKELLTKTGKYIESHGGNIENPILYDILAYTLAFIGSEGYFDFYKPTANQLVDKEIRRFASAMIPGRSLSHTLILVVAALTSLEVSLEYVKDKIRRKGRTVDKSMIRKEEYEDVIYISKQLTRQHHFVDFEAMSYEGLRLHFNKYFRALGVNSGRKLYAKHNASIQKIYKILFFELPNATTIKSVTDDSKKFFTYANTTEETNIKSTDAWNTMIVNCKDDSNLKDIVDKYFGLLLDGDKDYNKKIIDEIGAIEINFKNLVEDGAATGRPTYNQEYENKVKSFMYDLRQSLQILYKDWQTIYNDKENADDREDGSA